MKALTVRHPWAWAIIHGGKDVENRSRPTKYRGLLHIHAGKAMDFDAFTFPALEAAEERYLWKGVAGVFGELNQIDLSTCGDVIGTVEVTGCHDWRECGPGEGMCSAWAMEDYYHWELSNPQPIETYAATGKLGIWNMEPAQ